MLRNRISDRWAKSWQTPLPSRCASRPDECTPVVPGTYSSSLCTQFAAAITASGGSWYLAIRWPTRSDRLLRGA